MIHRDATLRTIETLDDVADGLKWLARRDKRLKAIDFSRPYAISAASFGVPKDSPLAALAGTGEILNLDDDADEVKATIEQWKPLLKDKTVGFQGGTIIDDFFDKYLKDVFVLRGYKTTEQHDLDLTAGRVDGIFAGYGALKATQEKPEFKDMVIAGTGMRGGLLGRGVAVGMRKEDTELKKSFDEAIKAAIADGTIKKLSEKWFKIDATPQV